MGAAATITLLPAAGETSTSGPTTLRMTDVDGRDFTTEPAR